MGMTRQLEALDAALAQGMPRRGWKVAIDVPEVPARLGLPHAGVAGSTDAACSARVRSPRSGSSTTRSRRAGSRTLIARAPGCEPTLGTGLPRCGSARAARRPRVATWCPRISASSCASWRPTWPRRSRARARRSRPLRLLLRRGAARGSGRRGGRRLRRARLGRARGRGPAARAAPTVAWPWELPRAGRYHGSPWCRPAKGGRKPAWAGRQATPPPDPAEPGSTDPSERETEK